MAAAELLVFGLSACRISGHLTPMLGILANLDGKQQANLLMIAQSKSFSTIGLGLSVLMLLGMFLIGSHSLNTGSDRLGYLYKDFLR